MIGDTRADVAVIARHRVPLHRSRLHSILHPTTTAIILVTGDPEITERASIAPAVAAIVVGVTSMITYLMMVAIASTDDVDQEKSLAAVVTKDIGFQLLEGMIIWRSWKRHTECPNGVARDPYRSYDDFCI